jgi:putative transposase
MSLKIEFVKKAQKVGARIAPLCREYGISRETGYKWLRRYKKEGYAGLEELSRRPESSPLATAEELVLAILEARKAHPQWGPEKLRLLLVRRFKEETPSKCTIARILKRAGQVRKRRSVIRISTVSGAPNVITKAPNELWTVDFKGWWRSVDGSRCEPLTVRDAFSRYILEIRVLPGTGLIAVKKVFKKLFRKYGLPEAIQCDNGNPFINVLSRGGLSRLSAWWVSLGIKVVRSRPGCPQDNGAHERMHRDLSAGIQAYSHASLSAVQRASDKWRLEFNHVRPHEALGGKTPAEIYHPSTRRGLKIQRAMYPSSWLVRKVSNSGSICVSNVICQIGKVFAGYWVALEPTHGFFHRVWFYDMDLDEIELAASYLLIDELALRVEKKMAKKGANKSCSREENVANT